MNTPRFDSGAEPFMDSLRERVQQTKAENARLRASLPVPVREMPVTEETQRTLRKTRALAVIGEGRRSVRGVWLFTTLAALIAVAAVTAVRFGWIATSSGPN